MTDTMIDLDTPRQQDGTLPFVETDGGRWATGRFKRRYTGDCVTRALAIAEDLPYMLVYRELGRRMQRFGRKGAGNGVYGVVYEPMLREAGYTCEVFRGVTLINADLPTKGTLIVHAKARGANGRMRHASHLFTIIDGVIHDTWNVSESRRDGRHYEVREVWSKPKRSTLRTLVRGADKPAKPKKATPTKQKVTRVTDADDMKIGKAWREIDPDGFKRWGKAAGTWSRAAAGAYLKETDPDMYASLFAR